MSDQRAANEPSATKPRADARRNRDAVIAAVAGLLKQGSPLTMRAVAQAAGVSRSTLYRHFGNPAELQRAVQHETLARVRGAVAQAGAETKPPLAELRAVVAALVQIGSELPLAVPAGPPPDGSIVDAARGLLPLAERVARAADIEPAPTRPWLEAATGHLVEACLQEGWRATDATGAVERVFGTITEPLDRGLLLLDAAGIVVALNRDARAALEGATPLEPGARAALPGGMYQDGSDASPEAHPLSVALATGEPQEGVRGRRSGAGEPRWSLIRVRPLRRTTRPELYGFVAVFTDVTRETRFERAQLKPPGQLQGMAAPLLDVLRALDEVPPPLLPQQLVAEAMRLAGGPVALYVLDIDGSHLLRLAGGENFPARLLAPLALGPELAADGLPDLTAHLERELPGVVMAPMWLRGRAVGVLLALRGSQSRLSDVARLGAAAMELVGGYTDVIDAARRRKDMNPAAEIQQSLLPPRIARIGGGELAGSVLPSYEVGGDWFDYVENRDGTWIAIADAAGKGPHAGGLGSVALAALRAARRNDATLEQAARTIDETVRDVGGPEFYVTAVIARWHSVYSLFDWINCGHPPPLLLGVDDTVEELATRPDWPLGAFERARPFRRHQRRLRDGDRLVLYSDGIARRRTENGLFGTDGIVRAATQADSRSATATARAIQEAVVSASEESLPDDAAVIVLAVNRGGAVRADPEADATAGRRPADAAALPPRGPEPA